MINNKNKRRLCATTLALLHAFSFGPASAKPDKEALRCARLANQFPVECDEADPSHCAQPAFKGCPAGFDGQLLTTGLAIHLGQEADSVEKEVQIAVTATAAWWRVHVAHEKNLGKIEAERAYARGEIEGSKRHWTEHPAFIVSMTLLGAVALVWTAKEVLKIQVIPGD